MLTFTSEIPVVYWLSPVGFANSYYTGLASIHTVTYRGYGNEARIDLKGNVNVLCERNRYTFYETGFVTDYRKS